MHRMHTPQKAAKNTGFLHVEIVHPVHSVQVNDKCVKKEKRVQLKNTMHTMHTMHT